MGPKFVQKGIRNVFCFALEPKTRSFSILCTPDTTHNEYLKQQDFYRIFHHRRAAPFMFQLLLRCRCLYIHADPWQDYVTTLSNCSTATAPRFPRIYDFPGATRPGDVIFLAGFHPVVTTYKEYLNNQTNTSSPPRRASFRHVFDTFMIFLTRSGPGSATAT